MKSKLKEYMPPALLRYLKGLFYGWHGNYDSWDAAKKRSTSYDDYQILNKVKDALLKVKNGEALYEWDSVIFDKIQYSFPLLSALLWVAVRNNGNLNLIDFNGSLGSSWYQNRERFFDKNYELVADSISNDSANITSEFKGYIFIKR